MTVEQAAAIHQVAVRRCEIHARLRDNANAVTRLRWRFINPFADTSVFREIAEEQEAERRKWLEIAGFCGERIATDPMLNANMESKR